MLDFIRNLCILDHMNSELFKAFRQSISRSQAEMAELLGGYSVRSIQHWESGRTPIPPAVIKLIHVMQAIAAAIMLMFSSPAWAYYGGQTDYQRQLEMEDMQRHIEEQHQDLEAQERQMQSERARYNSMSSYERLGNSTFMGSGAP